MVASSVTRVMVSAREASRIIETEAGVCRQQSRRALLAGVAGPGLRAGGSLLYDAHRVREIAQWPEVDHDALLALCPAGVFVLRLSQGAVDPGGSWRARAAALRHQTDVGDFARIQVRARLEDHGTLPVVATICGYPVLLAELVDLASVGPGRVRLALVPPDPLAAWLAPLRSRRLVTSPGPTWLLLGSQPYLRRAGSAWPSDPPPGSGRDTMWARAM